MRKIENFGLGFGNLFNMWTVIMKPHIDVYRFGSITIDGQSYDHDVVIELSGEIHKRNRKISKAGFGTPHMVSLEEAKEVFERGAERIIIGSGQDGKLTVSKEALDFFKKHKIIADVLETPQAIEKWNTTEGNIIAIFHVTC
jgi:hypothetical protein